MVLFGDLDWPINASRRFVNINWASCLEGSKDHVLAALLHHQPTFYDNKFHYMRVRRSSDPSVNDCHVVAKQIPTTVTLSRQSNVKLSTIVILRKQKQASFHAKKKTDFFIHAKCPNQAMTHASTTGRLLCLSHSVIFKHLCSCPNTS